MSNDINARYYEAMAAHEATQIVTQPAADAPDASASGTSSPQVSSRDTGLPVRDVHLEAEFESVPKYFVGGNAALSHTFAMLSATFPDGENYFVRSVAAVRGQVTDPQLAAEIDDFIGQEEMHGREHRAFNAHLGTLGYPTAKVEEYTEKGYRFIERLRAPRFHLAMTAAVEHYTATLAEMLLSDPEARAMFTHDATQRLFVWHALEESEHKAVAFDTFQHVGGGEFLRRFVMTLAHLDFISNTIGMTAWSMAKDPDARRHPMASIRSVGKAARSPFASASAAKQLAQYYRRGFHPNDRDTSGLISEWRRRLFE